MQTIQANEGDCIGVRAGILPQMMENQKENDMETVHSKDLNATPLVLGPVSGTLSPQPETLNPRCSISYPIPYLLTTLSMPEPLGSQEP